jgi:hypothetical protein
MTGAFVDKNGTALTQGGGTLLVGESVGREPRLSKSPGAAGLSR